MVTPELFYTYIWKDASGVPFYVGKGKGNRAWNTFNRSADFKAIYAAGGCAVEIVDEFIFESQAHAHEMVLIEQFGRREFGGLLVNRTDGGDGMAGHVQTDEHRAKISNALKGKPKSAAQVAKMRAANLGKTHSPSSLAKMSASQRRRLEDPVKRRTMLSSLRMRWASPTSREEQSAALARRWADPIARERASVAMYAAHARDPLRGARHSVALRKHYENPGVRERNALAVHAAPLRTDNTSGFKGVRFEADRNKWLARINFNGVGKNLGRFATAIEAAQAYDAAAIALWGEKCFLNLPKQAEAA